jgi:hypothetical protein
MKRKATMSYREHLLTIVEPTPGGDATLELAREAVGRGGAATVLMVITDRVRRDIEAFADAEELTPGEAEAIALHRLGAKYSDRIGGSPRLLTHYGEIGSDILRYITTDTTAIAVPDRLAVGGVVQRIVAYSGRPVIVAPSPAALSSTRAEAMAG